MEHATILTESFDPNRLPSGFYVAESTSEAYSLLRAMCEASGMGEVLGERYAPGGVKIVTVRISGTSRRGSVLPNAVRTMPMSRAFLVNVLNDYADWKQKWWRECVQNSVDAGAKNVSLDVQTQPDGSVVVTCTDDGHGMDVDTMLNKFLVFGETTKTHGDTAGGFGKAKEMLLLPWIWWRVESNGQKLEGVGNQYEEIPTPSPLRRGTRLSVCMPADMSTSSYHARAFLDKCNIPRVKFIVDGDEANASHSRGKRIRQFKQADVYHNKSADIRGIFVRTHGLYMFSSWLSSDVPGAIFVEVTVPSIEVLSSNRDSFRDENLARDVDQLQHELAVDSKSALTKSSTKIRETFRGSGLLAARSASSAVLANMPPLPLTKRGTIEITATAGEDIATTLVDTLIATRGGVDLGWGGGAGIIDKALASMMLTSTPILGQQHLENVTKQLAWEPDFFLMNDIEGYRVPKKFKPSSMTAMVVRLAKVWAELCRYVLVQLNYSGPYGVGFVFSDTMMACYTQHEGDDWLLVNPFSSIDPRTRGTTVSTDGSVVSYAKEHELKNLYSAAIHEATHMTDGVSFHNEMFSSAFTRNVGICADGFRVARKIASLVGKRKIKGEDEGEERKSKPKKAPSKPTLDPLVSLFLESIATAAAGYVADLRGESSSIAAAASNVRWAISADSILRLYDVIGLDISGEGDPALESAPQMAQNMFKTGRVALPGVPNGAVGLQVDTGGEDPYHIVVIAYSRSAGSEYVSAIARWSDLVARDVVFRVKVGEGPEMYKVGFE
jgi:hypothetical protein